MEHERFDRIVVPAQTSRSDGFPPDDIAWLLEHAPGELVVVRPEVGGRRPAGKGAVAPSAPPGRARAPRMRARGRP
jgi:hypothetical protein